MKEVHNLSFNDIPEALGELIIKMDKLEMSIKEAVSSKKEVISRVENMYLSRGEVAKRLNVSPQTITRYVKKGILRQYSVGRKKLFKKNEVECALEISDNETDTQF